MYRTSFDNAKLASPRSWLAEIDEGCFRKELVSTKRDCCWLHHCRVITWARRKSSSQKSFTEVRGKVRDGWTIVCGGTALWYRFAPAFAPPVASNEYLRREQRWRKRQKSLGVERRPHTGNQYVGPDNLPGGTSHICTQECLLCSSAGMREAAACGKKEKKHVCDCAQKREKHHIFFARSPLSLSCTLPTVGRELQLTHHEPSTVCVYELQQ